MTFLWAIEVAHVALCLHGRTDVRVVETESAVRPFVRTAPPPNGSEQIRITLSRAAIPAPAVHMLKCFDSGQAWSMWASGDRIRLALQPPGVARPLWVFDTDRRWVAGELYCHGDFWMETGPPPVLRNPLHYPLDQVLLMLYLAEHAGVIIHAAGAVIRGRGYLFAGRSGAGKSTLAALMAPKAGIELLSDDRVIVRRRSGRWVLCGTPWPGEAGIAASRCAPLGGVFFLDKDRSAAIAALDVGAAVKRLMPVSSIPLFDRPLGEAVLATCETLAEGVPAADFRFHRHPDAVTTLMTYIEGMEGRT